MNQSRPLLGGRKNKNNKKATDHGRLPKEKKKNSVMATKRGTVSPSTTMIINIT
jgi:hypothetical protein